MQKQTEAQLRQEIAILRQQIVEVQAQETERGQAEQMEKAHGPSFRLLFAENPLPMWVFDLESLKFLEVNDAAVAHYGYSREEFLQMRIVDIRPPEDIPRLLKALQKLGERLLPGGRHWRHRRKDGRIIEVEIRGHTLEFAGRKAFLNVVQDITEQKRAEEAVRTAEWEYREIFENAVEGIYRSSLDGRQLRANPALVKLNGYTSEEEMLPAVHDIAHEWYVDPQRREEFKRVLEAQGSVTDFESEVYRHKTRERIWISETARLVRDAAGTPLYYEGTVQDITARKRAEAALRESEQQLRQVTEYINAVFWVCTADVSKFLYVSPAYEEIWGHSRAELYERPWSFLDAVHPEDRQRVFAALQKRSERYDEEFRVIRPDGSVRWVRERAFLVRDENGKGYRIAGITEDITEGKLAEEKLRYSEEQLRQLTENINEVFWIAATDGPRTLYVSPAYEKVWGRSRDTVYENPHVFLDSVHPDDRERVLPIMREKWNTSGYDEEYRIVRPDGSVLWIRDRIFPVRNDAGEVHRVVGVSEDITLHKQAEVALEMLSRQSFEAQEAERRHLARELHDEIGQTLTALKINLEAMLQGIPKRSEARLHDSISMVDATLQQVRNLSLDLRPSQLDDLGLVETLKWYVDRQAQRIGLSMHLIVDPLLSRFDSTIETSCFRVTQEALTNIARHAGAHNVWVELRQHDNVLILTVSDDGIGFDAQMARERAVRGASRGILGMEERVRLAGGLFEIQAELGRGTAVRARFPIAQAKVLAPFAFSRALPPEGGSQPEIK